MNWSAGLLLLGITTLLGDQALSRQQIDYTVRSRPSQEELVSDIRSAAADQLYAVHLRFDRPVSIGELRLVVSRLAIPRVLAYVDYWLPPRGRSAGQQILGLGQMYARDAARHHSECRALISVNTGEANNLRRKPIDAWTTSKIHVYGTAHVIRELSSGSLLPAATPIDGSTAEPEHLRKLEEHTRDEVAQPLSKRQNVQVPAYCSRFIAPLDGPVLAGGFPAEFRRPGALDGEGFREYAFRVLAQLPRDSAVTIALKLDYLADVDALAALVEEYGIRGMRAELVPEHSNARLIALAELSTFGSGLHAQIHRARCQMRLGGEAPQASSEWFADWITVSLGVDNAVRFLSYPNLEQARVTGSYSIAELNRLATYFERRAQERHEVPKSTQIPAGCEPVYVHGDREDTGSFLLLPEPGG